MIRLYIAIRWWNLPVSRLDIATPLVVTPNVTIGEVVEIMKKYGIQLKISAFM